jgi:hypothetical protein
MNHYRFEVKKKKKKKEFNAQNVAYSFLKHRTRVETHPFIFSPLINNFFSRFTTTTTLMRGKTMSRPQIKQF